MNTMRASSSATVHFVKVLVIMYSSCAAYTAYQSISSSSNERLTFIPSQLKRSAPVLTTPKPYQTQTISQKPTQSSVSLQRSKTVSPVPSEPPHRILIAYRRNTAHNIIQSKRSTGSRSHVHPDNKSEHHPSRHERTNRKRNPSMVLARRDEIPRSRVQVR